MESHVFENPQFVRIDNEASQRRKVAVQKMQSLPPGTESREKLILSLDQSGLDSRLKNWGLVRMKVFLNRRED